MANYTWSVTNANGHDGDMVLRQYSSFNLSSGNNLQADNDCRGVMIFVDGDATINGTIRVVGAYGGTPADMTWSMIWKTASGTQSLDNTTTNWGNGSTDANGILTALSNVMNKMPNLTSSGTILSTNSASSGDATGGTGWGGGATNEGQNNNNQGSPFSGGAGNAGDIGQANAAATRYGGQGGDGGGNAYSMGRGAGNPQGAGNSGAGNDTGGLFVLCAKGNINGSGTIDCSGTNGGYAGFVSSETLYAYGGGGSGGGRIILIAGGTISGSLTTNVNGGSGGGSTGSKYLSTSGSRGNHGTVTTLAGVQT